MSSNSFKLYMDMFVVAVVTIGFHALDFVENVQNGGSNSVKTTLTCHYFLTEQDLA